MEAPDADALRAYDAQMRAVIPARSPMFGMVFERDGPVMLAHYGVCGRADHHDLGGMRDAELQELITRVSDNFAERGETVEWRVYGHDQPPDLPARLRAAGFAAGGPELVMAARKDDIADRPSLPPGVRLREIWGPSHALDWHAEQLSKLGPEITAARGDVAGYLRELYGGWGADILLCVLEHEGRVIGGGWLRKEGSWQGDQTKAQFAVLEGGVVHPRWQGRGLYRALTAYRASRTGKPYLAAIIPQRYRPVLERLGFTALTTATTHTRQPPSRRGRPVSELPDGIWDRFFAKFGHDLCHGVAEPVPSVTWSLLAIEADPEAAPADTWAWPRGPALASLEAIVRQGLLASTPDGGVLYYLDWQHPSYQFDPRRAGRPGMPPWPGSAYHFADHHIYLAPDLSYGCVADPHDNSLCVFGAELLAVVEDDLHALLGTTLRRDGHNMANRWRFGPEK